MVAFRNRASLTRKRSEVRVLPGLPSFKAHWHWGSPVACLSCLLTRPSRRGLRQPVCGAQQSAQYSAWDRAIHGTGWPSWVLCRCSSPFYGRPRYRHRYLDVEISEMDLQGPGARMIQTGYRMGMLASRAGATFLGSRWGGLLPPVPVTQRGE